jgi:hypothetical protein
LNAQPALLVEFHTQKCTRINRNKFKDTILCKCFAKALNDKIIGPFISTKWINIFEIVRYVHTRFITENN